MNMGRLIVLVLMASLCVACKPLSFSINLGRVQKDLDLTVVQREPQPTRHRIAIVDVSGMIYNFRTPGLLSRGENPVAVFHEKLQRAASDPDVKAIILRLNTPGGTVTASDAMYREVKRFRERTGKPVVVLMMDVAASGGYYLACASDHIIAYPSTVTGSIGVILQTFNVKPVMEKIGIEAKAFTSGDSKNVGSPFADMTDEHKRILQGLVDDFYAEFVTVVKQARPNINADRMPTITDGRIFSGKQALAEGLVDQLGDLHDAHAKAKELAKIDAADLVLYHRAYERVSSPYATSGVMPHAGGEGVTQINLAQINLSMDVANQRAGFYYLWLPVAD